MRIVLIITTILCSSLTTCFAQTDNYKASLKKMLEAGGTEATFKVAIKQMFDMFKKQYTNVPENVWTDFEKEFSQTSMDDLVDMLAPVYEKHMTQADLDKISEFFQTPIGKKYATSSPLIMQESMQVGQQWGMKVAQKFQESLKEKGY